MTLIIGIACTDGVVVASDSAASDLETGVKQPIEKIKQVNTLPIFYGASGDIGLAQKIHEELTSLTFKPSIKRYRQELRKLILPVLKESRDLHVPYPQREYNCPPPVILLFAGILDGKPWILEIEKDGRDTLYNEEMGDFAAIGSGKPWAHAFFRPHLYVRRNLELGKIFAYRILEDAINIAFAGLAMPIHIYTISADLTINHIDEAELGRLADTCEGWRELERETVGTLVNPEKIGEADKEIPKPED